MLRRSATFGGNSNAYTRRGLAFSFGEHRLRLSAARRCAGQSNLVADKPFAFHDEVLRPPPDLGLRFTGLEIVKPAYLSFWGKAGGVVGSEPAWHPIAYHSLDVAVVADALLVAQPRRIEAIARLLQTDPETARQFVVCLIALHDVGKFSKHFQAKSEEAWTLSVDHILGPWGMPPASRHDADGYVLRDKLALRTLMQPATGLWANSEFNVIWAAVTGHHGQPCNDERESFPQVSGLQSKVCQNAVVSFARDTRALFGSIAELPQPDEGKLKALSWLICGLTVVSDWIGSNRAWFPYCRPDQRLEQYWDYAKGKARDAIRRAGLVPAVLSADMSPQQLYPEFAGSLSPLQEYVRNMPLADGPSLTIIEDVTGSGKTEAAMLLAARLMGQGRADGLFFALPTMATANAMYERLGDSYERLFAEGARPSLVLAHGKRTLNARFTNSILPTDGACEGYEDAGSATCAAWIADDRRKVFLAQIGVGTIDQALLGVLPSRHQVLRLWGLSDRVLIVDEAHAYDAYMSKELERQLEFQAALGGSAIVLSATLPERQRQSLLAAFGRGLSAKHSMSQARDYPLVTHVGAGIASSHPVPSRTDRTRALPVRRFASFEDAAGHVSNMAEAGCAVAWIRNSVDDAIDAVEDLRRRGHASVLLHARFAMGDRLDIEEKVRAALGRQDKTGKRRGFLVVGTQILEQSLDYDVDVMVSDLAPVDSLIQRAGRLWRHARSERPVAALELCIFSPDPEGEVGRDWYRDMSPRAAAVYGHHGAVWRSAKALFDRGAIETPNGVRELIEAVYGSAPDDFEGIPVALHQASRNAIGSDSAARSFANAGLLNLADGYGGNLHLWTADTITPTRLGEAQTVFRLGKIEAGIAVPWYVDDNAVRAWALSEVSLSRHKATGVPDPDPVRAAQVLAAKCCWPKWEQETPLLVLEPDGDVWRGSVLKDRTTIDAVYCKRVGLRLLS